MPVERGFEWIFEDEGDPFSSQNVTTPVKQNKQSLSSGVSSLLDHATRMKLVKIGIFMFAFFYAGILYEYAQDICNKSYILASQWNAGERSVPPLLGMPHLNMGDHLSVDEMCYGFSGDLRQKVIAEIEVYHKQIIEGSLPLQITPGTKVDKP